MNDPRREKEPPDAMRYPIPGPSTPPAPLRRGGPVGHGRRGRLRAPIPTRARRGSTFIVVLAILSLLVLVATALSLTSRLEVLSAANYAEGIQSRMAAKTGLGIASARAAVEITGSTTTEDAPLHPHPALANAGIVDLRALAALQNVSLSRVWTQDASARINLNTADRETLTRLFAAVARDARVTDANPEQLARALVEARRGREPRRATDDLRALAQQAARLRNRQATPIGPKQPGALLLDVTPPDFRYADIRTPPLSRDRHRFHSLADLLEFPGASPALVAAAAPYLTVFSASKEYGSFADDTPVPLHDLNTLDVLDVHRVLQRLYGDTKPARLLQQFAVNLVDWRDADSVPTVFPGTEATLSPVIGLERVPFLTEVWPNSIYPEETDGAGQYVELHNPWSDPIDVTGWTLSVGGARVALRGLVHPGGFLVVTDVYDGLHAAEPADTPFDSFYSIFRVAASGTSRRLIENPTLRIPWVEGVHRVELRDEEGRLIDVFVYTVRTPLRGQKTSHQRQDPRLRAVQLAGCTPFGLPRGTPARLDSPDFDGDPRYPGDRLFVSRLELLKVFAGFTDTATGNAVAGFPVLGTPNSPDPEMAAAAAHAHTLDARMLDVFHVEEANLWRLAADEPPVGLGLAKPLSRARPRTGTGGETATLLPQTRAQRGLARLLETLETEHERRKATQATTARDRSTLAVLAARAFLPLEEETRLGRVNLNTAPELVLGCLPGLDETLAAAWAQARRERLLQTASTAESAALFRRPSDLLGDAAFWRADGGDDAARYRRLTRLLPVATFTTSSVFMDSRTAVQRTTPSQSRHPSVSHAQALVAFDRGGIEFVAWSQSP